MTRGTVVRAIAFVFLAVAVGASTCRAGEARTNDASVDTEHLFGFNTGTDIGNVGGKELESETDGRFGKRTGSYAALAPMLGFEVIPADNLRLEMQSSASYHDVAGVSGLDDRRQAGFDGLRFEARYRLLDRATSAFGLAIDANPHWGLVDATSGTPVDRYGIDLAVLADKELVGDRLIGVFNLLYQPESVRSRLTGAWTREAMAGGSTGLMLRVRPGIFIGAEARYLRAYDSASLDNFAGQALFAGPMVFVRLSDHWWTSAALSIQVAGRALDEPGALDLTNFERCQAKFRLGYNF
jgi:hypothetical protein